MNSYLAIENFLNKHIKSLGKSYTWKINTDRLPVPYKLKYQTSYENNLDLRLHLSRSLKNCEIPEGKIEEWYVSDWGGVRANRTGTLQSYLRMSERELISLGKKGIASWSKILSLRDPKTYCIYDARVAFSLNAIQIIGRENSKIFFPMVPSRNTIISSTQKIIISLMNHEIKPKNFYDEYLKLLKGFAEKNPSTDIQSAEMVLFSQAVDLACRIKEINSTRSS